MANTPKLRDAHLLPRLGDRLENPPTLATAQDFPVEWFLWPEGDDRGSRNSLGRESPGASAWMEKAESLLTSASLVPESSAPLPKSLLAAEAVGEEGVRQGFLESSLHPLPQTQVC